MSTILDSLKKSSDKRDDNNRTSIDGFSFSRDKKTSKSGVIITISLIFITAVILYFGYQYINNDEETIVDSTTTAQQTQNSDVKPTEQNNIKNENKKQTKLQKPNSEAVRKQLAANNKTPKQPQLNKAPSNNKNKVEPSTLGSKPLSKSDTPKPDPKSGLIQFPHKDSNKQKELKTKPKINKQNYLYVYQLPFSVRKEMPKFKLNIHIYDENQENRVAVINGVKYLVGELIDDQVLIKEIVREGVVLELNGHVFLLPNL